MRQVVECEGCEERDEAGAERAGVATQRVVVDCVHRRLEAATHNAPVQRLHRSPVVLHDLRVSVEQTPQLVELEANIRSFNHRACNCTCYVGVEGNLVLGHVVLLLEESPHHHLVARRRRQRSLIAEVAA